MKSWVNYGNEKLSFSIPEGCSVFELNPNLINMGKTSSGISIEVFAGVMESDVRMLCKR